MAKTDPFAALTDVAHKGITAALRVEQSLSDSVSHFFAPSVTPMASMATSDQGHNSDEDKEREEENESDEDRAEAGQLVLLRHKYNTSCAPFEGDARRGTAWTSWQRSSESDGDAPMHAGDGVFDVTLRPQRGIRGVCNFWEG
jgi:hypothetical protein